MEYVDTLKRLREPRVFSLFGTVGSVIGFLSSILPAAVYEGSEGQVYSIFNHFISELGELGVSELAWVFNVGLILAGLAFIPFMIGLGLHLENIIAKVAMVVGVFSSITIVFMGIYPMNYRGAHALAALSFFFSGLFMAGLWSLAIIFQREPRIHRGLSLFGFISTACFVAFVSVGTTNLDPVSERPDFWLLPTLEWAVYFSIIGYLLAVSLYARLRTEHRNGSSLSES